MSYAGTCNVGITTDRAAVADPDEFYECLTEGFEAVLDVAGHSNTPRVRRPT
jgi:hypothetical protein